MYLNSSEVHFLNTIEKKLFNEALQFLEQDENLLRTTNSKTILGIMLILLMSEAYQDCIEFAFSKDGLCFDSDFYYNLAFAYEALNDYENACANYRYAQLNSFNSELSDDAKFRYTNCHNALFNPPVLFINKNKTHLKTVILINNKISLPTRLLSYMSQSGDDYTILETNKLILFSEKKSGFNNSNFINENFNNYLSTEFNQVIYVLDDEFTKNGLNSNSGTFKIIMKDIESVNKAINVVTFYIEDNDDFQFEMFKLKLSWDKEYKNLFGSIDQLLLSLETLKKHNTFKIKDFEFDKYIQIQNLITLNQVDDAEKELIDFINSNRVNLAFMLLLVFIYKIKNNITYGLFYLNQVAKIQNNSNEDKVQSIYSDFFLFFLSKQYITIAQNPLLFEDEIRYSYKRSYISKIKLFDLVRKIMPMTLIVETYRGCNLKCPLCPIQGYKDFDNKHSPMYEEVFHKVLEEEVVFNQLAKIYLHNLGEPLLNNQISQMISSLKNKYSHVEISLDSNLSLFVDIDNLVLSGIDEIVVAVDGYDQASYQKYRVNGKFEKLLQNVKMINSKKTVYNTSKPRLIGKTVVFKHLEPSLNKIINIITENSFDQCMQQKPIVFNPNDERYIKTDISEWVDVDSIYSRYDSTKYGFNNELSPINNKMTHCKEILSSLSPVINYDGNIFPCCVISVDNKYSFGNILKDSFYQIWTSDNYTEFRLNKLLNHIEYDFCKYCDME